MNIFTLYSILFSIISCLDASGIIKADYFHFRESYYIRVFFGKSFQSAFHAINFNLTHSWTFNFFYQPNNRSKTIKEIPPTTIINGASQKGYDIYDSIALNRYRENNDAFKAQSLLENYYEIDDFRFYYINIHLLPSNSRDDGLSFAFKNDEESSLTHQFYNKGLTGKKAFAIMQMENPTEMSLGAIYFGGIPKEEMSQFNSHSKCKQNEDEVVWSCMLNKIYFWDGKGYKMDSSEKVFFNPKEKDITFPANFFDFLTNKVFEDDLNNHKCRFRDPYILNCDKKVLEKERKIYYVIGNFEISNDISTYFVCARSSCDGRFLRGNSFIFGTMFLKNYASLFDYEEKEISFFGNSSMRKVGDFEDNGGSKSTNSQVSLFLILGFICLCGALLSGFTIVSKL